MAGAMTADTTIRRAATPRNPVRRMGGRGVALLTCVIAAGLAQLPVLRDPWAFYSDDAATQILPTWHHLGELVRGGAWPPLLDPDSWMGGNLAVEALFGVWNPVNALMWVGVSLLPNLAVAGIIVRTVAFVAVAFGCYGLCREYGAAPWASSVVAVTIPFCGSLFYFDALKWPAALVAFVWIPYLWWVTRRVARGRTNAIWVFVLGALAVTAGNPYAMLGVVLVLVGVLVETALLKRWRSVRRLFLVSSTVAAVVPLVYLPLLLSASVTWRGATSIGNSGTLAPGLGDLLNLSLPGYVPEIPGVGDSAVYFCWFALPLLPWLHWATLRDRWRELGGCLVMGAFLLLAIGPSELWMFRWPLRVLHYGYLAAAVPLAVVLSAGLRRDYTRVRAFGTAGLLAFSFFLAWAAAPDPQFVKRNLVALLVVGALTTLAVWSYRTRGSRRFAAVLHVGTAIAFALQVFWFLGSHSAMPYYFPSSVPQARAQFEHRYQGQVLQIGDPGLVGEPSSARPAWRDFVPGNLYRPAGVNSVNSYTGMGFTRFSDQLCMGYNGATCRKAYPALWRIPVGSQAPLADLLRLDTVVVQRKMLDNPRVPPGWRVSERNSRITVLERASEVARTPGRLSWSSPGTHIEANTSADARHEQVRFDRRGQQGAARLVFARLAWPGYTARLNGVPVSTDEGPNGLLRVNVPPEVRSGQLRISWSPPGMQVGLVFVAAGALGAGVLAFAQHRRRRKTNRWNRDPEPGVWL